MSKHSRSWSDSFLGAVAALLVGSVALGIAVDTLKRALPVLAVGAGVFLVIALGWRLLRRHDYW